MPEHNESELKSLFQAMRQADAQRAPSFTRSLRAMPYRDRLGYLRAIAVAAVAVVIVIVAGLNALRQRGGESPVPTQSAKVESAAPAQTAKGAGETFVSTKSVSTGAAASGGGTPPLQPAGRRRSKGAKTVPSISAWKSPTDALLKTPGDDLRTTVPSIRSTKVLPSPSSE